jgi:hypothetical protein
MHFEYNPSGNYFSFQRIRLHFKAEQPQIFPQGKAGNMIRGALGWALHDISPEAYTQYFQPVQEQGEGPSGFRNQPRPFVLRAHHLDGQILQTFHVDLHLFRETPLEPFLRAFEKTSLGRLDNITKQTITVPLDSSQASAQARVHRLTLRFLTPTELKSAGDLTLLPAFPVVFSRTRDRIRSLSGHALNLDFDGMAQRAQQIALTSHQLIHNRRQRSSSKTGQTHALGGFTGDVVYTGDLNEFLPFLEAAHFTGIGRQTVWGKGVMKVVNGQEQTDPVQRKSVPQPDVHQIVG